MKKTFILEGLDCANCAAKIEAGVAALEGVTKCSVTFLTQKMKLEFDDAKEAEIIEAAKAIVKKTEPDTEMVEA